MDEASWIGSREILTRRRKLVWGMSLVVAMLVLSSAAWLGMRYIDTESMACECGDPVDGARLAALNPFRDREPERIAINVVKTHQSGKCDVVSPGVTYCPEDMLADVASWKLTGRTASQDGLVFRFWVTRRPEGIDPEDGDPFWVHLSKNSNSWKVDRVDTYY